MHSIHLPANFNKEQATSISNGEYPKRVMEGQPIGSFFGFKYEGVYPTDEDALGRDAQGNLILDNDGNPMPMIYGTYSFHGRRCQIYGYQSRWKNRPE